MRAEGEGRDGAELTLYVRQGQPECVQAREALQAVILRIPHPLRIVICDVDDEPERLRELAVTLTPLLHVRIDDETAGWISVFETSYVLARLREFGLLEASR